MDPHDQAARELVGASDDSPIVKLCDALCWEGGKQRWDLILVAPDGHIRSQANGEWRDVMDLPVKMVLALVRRFKVVAQLDLIHHVPEQTGSARFLVDGRPFDIHVRVRRAASGEESVTVEFVHAAA